MKSLIYHSIISNIFIDEEEDEQELLLSVFRSLAGRKAYIAPKDLLDWDIVLELMGEVKFVKI